MLPVIHIRDWRHLQQFHGDTKMRAPDQRGVCIPVGIQAGEMLKVRLVAFAIEVVESLEAAQDKPGITMYSASAIPRIRIAIFVVFMIALGRT